MTEKRDYYEILGVAKDVSKTDLKKAYRKVAIQFHPDKNPDKSAEDAFKLVNTAHTVLSDPEKRAIFDRRGVEGVAFDEMPMPDLSVDDLDIKVAEEMFKGRRVLDEKALITLKLLRQEQGKLVPTKGAMLLFGKERTFHFPDAWVQCGRFIGQDKADIFDHIEIEEPLPKAIESIMLFLKKHAMRGADFSEIRRKDVWSIPLGILREAIINALVHSDYSQRGAPIRIAFFDDRIEIENPGILLPIFSSKFCEPVIFEKRSVIVRSYKKYSVPQYWHLITPLPASDTLS